MRRVAVAEPECIETQSGRFDVLEDAMMLDASSHASRGAVLIAFGDFLRPAPQQGLGSLHDITHRLPDAAA